MTDRSSTYGGIATVAFSAAFIVASVVNPKITWGSVTGNGLPGAGAFPIALGVLGALLGVALTVRGVLAGRSRRPAVVRPEDHVVVSRDDTAADDAEDTTIIRRRWFTVGVVVVAVVAFFELWLQIKLFYLLLYALMLTLTLVFPCTTRFRVLFPPLFTAFVYVAFGLAFSVNFEI